MTAYEETLAGDVAVRVRAWRELAGLTQEGFGMLLGTSQAWVSTLESGRRRPGLETLMKLTDVMGQDFSVDIRPDGTVRLRSALV